MNWQARLAKKNWQWMARIAMVILVGTAALIYLIPREVAKWYAAHAIQAAAAEDFELARAKMEAAIRWNPDSAVHYAERAAIEQAAKDFEAADRYLSLAIELEPRNAGWYFSRALVRQRLGKYEAAIRDLDVYISLVTDNSLYSDLMKRRYADGLNARAYARAIANREIRQGLADVEKALLILESLGESVDTISARSAFLDTRGYLLYLAGRFDEAKVDLEKAVGLAEALMKQPLVDTTDDPLTQDRIASTRQRLNENLSVLLHHRGLVYAALQQEHAAEADFKRALELGYNPEEGVF
jgi:tetratricopeptide (TPR) repeat protein